MLYLLRLTAKLTPNYNINLLGYIFTFSDTKLDVISLSYLCVSWYGGGRSLSMTHKLKGKLGDFFLSAQSFYRPQTK